VNGAGVQIAEIHLVTPLLGNSCRQSHSNSVAFESCAQVKGAFSAQVRRMREYSPRHVRKLLPLFCKVIPAVVANSLDIRPMGVAELGDVRSVNHHLAL